jgi:hypothetical protein
MSESKKQPSDPTPEQVAATIAVLADDRGPVQEAAQRRLLAWGERALPHLREYAEAEPARLRMRCRALLRTLEVSQLQRRFAGLGVVRSTRPSAPALLEGAVLLAKMVRTFVPEPAEIAAVLRREAGELRRACAERSLPASARLLAERLHDLRGLRAAESKTFTADDVLLDRVLGSRRGAPVTLSLIYLLVARWAGLSAAGVALPNHFLVRLHGTRPVLIDPFHGGRSVTKADCARFLRASGYDRVAEHLRDRTDREVLTLYAQALRGAGLPTAASAAVGQALRVLESR